MSEASLLVLARAEDAALELLRERAAHRVIRVDVGDLFRVGWRFVGGRPDQACAHAGGRVIPVDQIGAVLCRIHAVTRRDLPHLHVDDQDFAVAETNAFLRAWLEQYRGIRFNAPSSVSLAGPAWHPLRWTWHVGSLGVPVTAPDVTPPDCESMTAIVAGDEVIGTTDAVLIDHSLRIARSVRSRLLAVQFVRDRDWKFLTANPCPPLDGISASAVLRYTLARERRDESNRVRDEVHAGVACRAA